MNLKGRTALISGGKRLGAMLADELAGRGTNILLTYHTSRDEAEAAAERCRSHGVRAETVQADLRRHDETVRVLDTFAEHFDRLDVLVNLTSIYTRTPFDTLEPSDFDDMLDSNLRAPYWMAVDAAKRMKRQPIIDGLQGKILHFTDWAVERPYNDYLPYLVAKGGLVTLTKTLAVELAPTILVNSIAPGTVLPPPNASEETLESIRQSAALETLGSPRDVIAAALYLLEGTDYVTGEVYRVDGGRFLGHPRHNTPDF